MTDDDPLAGLDDVPWAQLQHSYGMADDVPGHLRAMQAGVWDGRYPPSAQLANHIVHQGTRSQAAVYTAPFLVRMALDPRLVNRHRFVGLLVAIAIGLDNNYLPNGYDPREDRANLANLRGEADDWAQWIGEAADDKQRKQREESYAQVLIDAEAVVRSYDAVREALPALAVLLTSGSPELRAETANLLAWFPESAETSIPLLKAFIADEGSPGAAATGVVALGLLGEPATVPFIGRYLDSPIVELRWASAFALTRFGIAGPAVVEVLTQVVARPPEKAETMSFLSGSYSGLAAMALAEASEPTTLRAVDAMLVSLAEGFYDRYYTGHTLFTLVFPGDPAEPPQSFGDLSNVQQQVVRFVADQDEAAWPFGAMDALRRWKVPTRHSDLRVYAGIGQAGQ
ncbi:MULTISPECIES: HEAT repeat domain-containing protein [unclassified Streptomyces]|uniref:HEAT repeat domain-containing protein n=1 Tax=unclassified Streptomyces TaxID=2593676 RepID=UPI002E8073D9|nr:HEAT repeat domain-containing protein [Streptomyces sp. NBC_00562]WTD38014.1 HEAT repeat domain-containing protein [Streptomyces sp. NBC_01643]WUC24359.1 HEAT repeat domain-containing protein [Streptomyces sp. NBC_00562]